MLKIPLSNDEFVHKFKITCYANIGKNRLSFPSRLSFQSFRALS
ncbi:hypothetical protein LEP1GSC068_0257 [Leptospira sp. Fiocruz LV3954]|nr:hypothetical protein LEP1GSC068_0257 [Leptospira sp. Fiocruz LV3954]EMJ46465.1 hypothetical protein LEP1GSC169_3270 [Leptospira santarosai str. HAI1349]